MNIQANIRKLYLGRLFGGFELIGPVFVIFLLANNLTMTQVLLLQSFFTAIVVLMEVPSGVIADLFGLRNTLVLSELFWVLTFLTYGLSHSFIGFFVAEFFSGLALALGSGADTALVYDTLAEGKQQSRFKRITGNMRSIWMMSLGVGAITGGILASTYGLRPMFFFTALFAGIGLLIFLGLEEPTLGKKHADRQYLRHLKEGVSYTITHPMIKYLILLFSFFGAFVYLLYYLMQPYFEHSGLSLPLIGVAVSGYFFFIAIGYMVTDHIADIIKNDILLIILSAVGITIGFFAMSLGHVWIGFVAVIFIMFLGAIAELTIEHIINNATPSSHRVTVLSVKNLSKSLLYTLIAPLVGYVADLFSLRFSLLLMAVILAVWLLFVLVVLKIEKP